MQAGFNFEPLTPTAFLHRSATVFPDRIGVVDGSLELTYGEFLDYALKFAGALKALGVKPGDRVAVLAGNSHVMLAAHYAVPFAGAVLVALNTRITSADMAYIVGHSGASVLVYDTNSRRLPRRPRQAGPRPRLVRAGGEPDELEASSRTHPRPAHQVADERSLLAHRLHQRHDGASERRDVSPPRRLPAGTGDGAAHGPLRRFRLPVDAADVPLQRLVLSRGA